MTSRELAQMSLCLHPYIITFGPGSLTVHTCEARAFVRVGYASWYKWGSAHAHACIAAKQSVLNYVTNQTRQIKLWKNIEIGKSEEELEGTYVFVEFKFKMILQFIKNVIETKSKTWFYSILSFIHNKVHRIDRTRE